MKVPEVLLSGNHEHIRGWREGQQHRRTADRRNDLLEQH
jgi:tRNA (guanine37-N1)-methyltransferase